MYVSPIIGACLHRRKWRSSGWEEWNIFETGAAAFLSLFRPFWVRVGNRVRALGLGLQLRVGLGLRQDLGPTKKGFVACDQQTARRLEGGTGHLLNSYHVLIMIAHRVTSGGLHILRPHKHELFFYKPVSVCLCRAGYFSM